MWLILVHQFHVLCWLTSLFKMFIAQEITLTPSESISTLNDARVTKQHGKRLKSLCVSYNTDASKGEKKFYLLQEPFVYLALLANVEK